MSRLTITIAAGIIIILAGAIWLYPRMMQIAAMRPLDKPFDAYPQPPAPHYADPASWAALPGAEHPDAADMVPLGEAMVDQQSVALVDVFYIHPTTYRGRDNWNQDLSDQATNAWTNSSFIARQATAFNGCCRVYAPRYRQAASASLYATDDSGTKAYALAYEDIKAAFRHYLDRYNDGRPFILAGHSQGALHVQRLLEDMVDATAIRPQLVAAYMIGIGVPYGVFERQFKTLSPCAEPTDTGCVISWNTFGRGGRGQIVAERSAARYESRYQTREGADILCVNPLTFALDTPDAPASANLGALPGSPSDEALAALMPGTLGATCQDGVLYVDLPDNEAFNLQILAGQNLHFHDIDLFFKNIRDNATLRAETFLKARGHVAP